MAYDYLPIYGFEFILCLCHIHVHVVYVVTEVASFWGAQSINGHGNIIIAVLAEM